MSRPKGEVTSDFRHSVEYIAAKKAAATEDGSMNNASKVGKAAVKRIVKSSMNDATVEQELQLKAEETEAQRERITLQEWRRKNKPEYAQNLSGK
ncbi:hypothetical protein LTR56_019660 [Elasticomyces elasticus]|nr:hypothetical protein LTR56_019660 [Elasticomyces elasticus]KAK3662351.1 hypothetical protein LTR22_006884 [Elasticomyces elasticus]KAK4924710.1 hypothetical protein LTR49_008159 [Elasticomyces elasticus]KAK5730763.1 hypothetical protein LTR15_000701 [Elasticomyces elasticus]KAK5766884.1 hypothetical protein LTS12_002960 [Elasticomyces elasticus]